MADDFAGGLRERVAVETWIDARGDDGASVGFWQPRGAVHAAVVPDAASGARGVEAEARRSTLRWRVTMRPVADIGLASRLIWGSHILVVLGVDSDPRQPDRIVLRCEARGG
ncbi:MAG: head-tail adaptor protein [Sandarakinorhabdus sp.]|nr:head-tail adaptor protein [Sandarakinorhabdus sp.]